MKWVEEETQLSKNRKRNRSHRQIVAQTPPQRDVWMKGWKEGKIMDRQTAGKTDEVETNYNHEHTSLHTHTHSQSKAQRKKSYKPQKQERKVRTRQQSRTHTNNTQQE